MKNHYCDVVVRGKEKGDFFRFLKLPLSRMTKKDKAMSISYMGEHSLDLGDITNIVYEGSIFRKPALIETYADDITPVKHFYDEWRNLQAHLYHPEIVEIAKLWGDIHRVRRTKDRNKAEVIAGLEKQIAEKEKERLFRSLFSEHVY